MRVVDLFAGCGGMSLGFQEAGFNIVGAFENWQPAIDCYKKNLSHSVFNVDLSNVQEAVSKISTLCPDIIIGGPPCQDFSSAGNRKEANRANLTRCYALIIKAIQPKIFIMENVDRARNSEAYTFARDIFKTVGYGLTEMVLDASLCGAPQKRKRFICFGKKGEKDNFALFNFTSSMRDEPMTLREYAKSINHSLDFEFYYRHPRNYCRRAIFSIDEPAPTIRGVNRPIPKGYKGNKNDACPISNKNIHVLTTKERALIQTFPDNWIWEGSKTDTEQMIGNAVPVELSYYIAKAVLKAIEYPKNLASS